MTPDPYSVIVASECRSADEKADHYFRRAATYSSNARQSVLGLCALSITSTSTAALGRFEFQPKLLLNRRKQ
jgi:hypothetical protein